MATEQLPASQYEVGGQETVSGWVVTENGWSFEEDSEAHQDAAGQHKCDITYSRRKVLSLSLKAENGTTVDTFDEGGTYTHDAVAYKIRSVNRRNTRGPVEVDLELISQVDLLA